MGKGMQIKHQIELDKRTLTFSQDFISPNITKDITLPIIHPNLSLCLKSILNYPKGASVCWTVHTYCSGRSYYKYARGLPYLKNSLQKFHNKGRCPTTSIANTTNTVFAIFLLQYLHKAILKQLNGEKNIVGCKMFKVTNWNIPPKESQEYGHHYNQEDDPKIHLHHASLLCPER